MNSAKPEIATLGELYLNAAFRVSSTFGPTPTYSGEALEKIVKTMESDIPLNGTFRNYPWSLDTSCIRYHLIIESIITYS